MPTEIKGEFMWPMFFASLAIIMCGIYLWDVMRSFRHRTGRNTSAYSSPSPLSVDLTGIEGFANPGDTTNTTDGSGSGSGSSLKILMDKDCYDDFYAAIYDTLIQPSARAGLETQVPLEWLVKERKRTKSDLRVADIGCGTGLHVELFRRQGVHSVVGVDRSTAMIATARKRYPESIFLEGDATVTTMGADSGHFAADAFDLVTLYYFTIYLIPDRTTLLRNMYMWLAPGGLFVAHVVNKLKFDPVLEAASPFVGFSVQKYADERITTSSVTFKEFEYTGDFQLHGSRGVFEEEFRFPGGQTRKHEQRVWMPTIESLVEEVAAAGFKYAHHVDLTPIGYEYQYLFFFEK